MGNQKKLKINTYNFKLSLLIKCLISSSSSNQAWVIEKSNGKFPNDYHYHYLMGNGPLDLKKKFKINGNGPLYEG